MTNESAERAREEIVDAYIKGWSSDGLHPCLLVAKAAFGNGYDVGLRHAAERRAASLARGE